MAGVSLRTLALDTNCWIYLLDDASSARGRWLETEVVRPAVAQQFLLVTATLSLAELLVGPHRQAGRVRAAAVRQALEGTAWAQLRRPHA